MLGGWSSVSGSTFRKIFLEIGDGVIGSDKGGTIKLANPAAAAIFGWHDGELVGKPLTVLLPERTKNIHHELVAAFSSGEVETRRMGQRGSGIMGRRADGSEVNLGITILKTDDDGEPLMIAVVRDISEHVRRQTELKRLAETDPLTGLLNRRAFFSRATVALDELSDQEACILLLDLDHFKSINDNYGHDVGDQVIQEFANILRECISQNELVARWGGEEFVVLLQDKSKAASMSLAQKIRTCTAERRLPSAGKLTLHFTVSAGVADLSGGLTTALKRADAALYIAKNAGRNRVFMAAA